NVYEQLLTDWLAYADAHNLDRELAFYHASQPLAWSGASAASMPVNWFWSVFRSNLGKLTNFSTASRDPTVGDLPFAIAGESVYLGYPEKLRELNVNLYMGGSNGWTGELEYATAVDSTGKPTEWQTLTTLSDTTTNFAKSGRIVFDPPADWKPSS